MSTQVFYDCPGLQIRDLLAAGTFKPVIDRTYPLEGIAGAYRLQPTLVSKSTGPTVGESHYVLHRPGQTPAGAGHSRCVSPAG